MDAKTLEMKLTSADGFKPLVTGMGKGKKAKASFEVYGSAEEKGVYDLYNLRQDEHDDCYYGIYVFSTKGEIEETLLKELQNIVEPIDLGTIRYEGASFSKLEPIWGPEGSFRDENRSISEIADEIDGLYVLVLAEFDKKVKWDFPLVIYAKKDNLEYAFPVPGTKL